MSEIRRLMRRLTLPREVALLEEACEQTYTFKWKWFKIPQVTIRHGVIKQFRATSLPITYCTRLFFHINRQRLTGCIELSLWKFGAPFYLEYLEQAFRHILTKDLDKRAGSHVSESKEAARKLIKELYGVEPVEVAKDSKTRLPS